LKIDVSNYNVPTGTGCKIDFPDDDEKKNVTYNDGFFKPRTQVNTYYCESGSESEVDWNYVSGDCYNDNNCLLKCYKYKD
jgi:hypothetical protein